MKFRQSTGHTRPALLFAFVLAMSSTAFELVAQASPPLALVLDLGAEAGFDREQVASAIAKELDRPIAVAVQESSADTLVVTVDAKQVKLIHIENARATHRSASLPNNPKDRLRHIVWLASNLCNDQVAAFAGEADNAVTQFAIESLPLQTVVEPKNLDVSQISPAAVSDNAMIGTKADFASVSEGSRNWTIALSMGPTTFSSRLSRQSSISSGSERLSDIYEGLSQQIDVGFKSSQNSQWLGSVVRGGSSHFMAGFAVSKRRRWKLSAGDLAVFGGLGLSIGNVRSETYESMDSSQMGISTTRTVSVTRGADPIALTGVDWTFPATKNVYGIVKLIAVIPNTDPGLMTLVALSLGAGWTL